VNSSGASPRSFPAATLALVALALAAAAIAVRFTWQSDLASLYDDSVSYLVMAQALAPFHPASAAVTAAWPNEKYPPAFPLLLALTGGAFDWRIAHALVAVSFAASVFAIGYYARLVIGSATIALAAAAVCALLPGSWLLVKGILSEFPYIALAFAALAMHEKGRLAVPSRRASIALGLLLAAVVLTRTIGVTLYVAIAAAEGVRFFREHDRRRLRALAWPLALPVFAAALWYALRPAGGVDAYVVNGMEVLDDALHGGRWRILEMALANTSALVDAWLYVLLIYWGETWSPQFLLACAIGGLGLGWALLRAARAHADGLYCILFLVILSLWPFPGQMYRLVFPPLPLVMGFAFWAVAMLIRRPPGEAPAGWPAYVAFALPFALCAPPLVGFVVERARVVDDRNPAYRMTDIAEFYRIPSRPAAEANAQDQIGVFSDMDRIRLTTPERARIMWYAPNYVALLAGRHGVPLARPADAAAFAAQVRAARPDFIYLAGLHPRDSARRLGDPLAPVEVARSFTHRVWQRTDARGELRAVLLAVDPGLLEAPP
jgi:hypothetical protein